MDFTPYISNFLFSFSYTFGLLIAILLAFIGFGIANNWMGLRAEKKMLEMKEDVLAQQLNKYTANDEYRDEYEEPIKYVDDE